MHPCAKTEWEQDRSKKGKRILNGQKMKNNQSHGTLTQTVSDTLSVTRSQLQIAPQWVRGTKLWTVTHREIYTTVVIKSFINILATTKDNAVKSVCDHFFKESKDNKKLFKLDFQISEHKELDNILDEAYEQRESTTFLVVRKR